MIVSCLESSSSRNKPLDSCLWLGDSKMTSSKSGSGSGFAKGGFSVLMELLILSLEGFLTSICSGTLGCLGVINAATTVVEGCWGVARSQEAKGQGGGGTMISSERVWGGLGTEILEVRLNR